MSAARRRHAAKLDPGGGCSDVVAAARAEADAARVQLDRAPLLLCHACVLAPRRYIYCMEGLDRITIEPGKMGGQPCIRGHRFTVEHLLSLVGAGWTLEQIQTDFPFIEAADIQQSSAYAAFSVREYHLPVTRPA
jgi:uncharacterized protein (DUF433 family)